MKRTCPLLFLAIGAATGLAAQQDARPLIHQVVATFKNAKSYHFESDTESDLTGELRHSWTRGHLVVAKDQPDLIHFESVDSNGAEVAVSDGKTLWRATPNTREFMRSPVTGPILDAKGAGPVADSILRRAKFAMASLERLEENLNHAEQLRTETLLVDGKPAECVVVRADYNPPVLATGIESFTRTLWIDPQRNLLLQELDVTYGKLFPSSPFDSAESKHLTRYTVASIGEPVPAKLFTYSPPAAFREVDRLEPAYPRPAKDLIGKPAPELSLPTLTGETLKLSDLRGKIVLLDFWATWCEPCRNQMPAIAKLHAQIKDQGVVLLGVDDDETTEEALKFVREHGYAWPSLYDGKIHEARGNFKVKGIPTLVLIDSKGTIVDYELGAGASTEESIRSALKKLGATLP